MTILPQPSSPAGQWLLNDYRQTSKTSDAATGGVALAQYDAVPDNELWLLERISVSCSSTSETTCTLYLDTVDERHVLDYTPSGNADIADEAAPVVIPTNSILLVQWDGASDGAIGTALAQLQILRRQTS